MKAFLLGAAASTLVAATLLMVLAVVAQADRWDDVRLAVGPVVLLDVGRTAEGTETTLGAGLVLVALAGGLLNLAAALALRRRARRAPPHGVD